jgi:hypothetical protein
MAWSIRKVLSTAQASCFEVVFQGVEVSSFRRVVNAGKGLIQAFCSSGLMKPELPIRNGLGCFNHPDSGFVAIDHHCAACKLLAQGDLPAGADLLDAFRSEIYFMPSCWLGQAACGFAFSLLSSFEPVAADACRYRLHGVASVDGYPK